MFVITGARLREPPPRSERQNVMRRKAASIIAAATLLVACGNQSLSETQDSLQVEEFDMESELAAPIAPSGEKNYELFTTEVDVVLRPGESRTVPISVRNVGLLGAVWTVTIDDFRTPSGVSVTGLPDSVDLTSESESTVMIELTADATATPGDFGNYLIGFDDPTAPDVRAYGAGAPVNIDIVDSSSLIGPAMSSDIVESPAVGVIFDPTINDIEGDAPLDASALSIVDPPRDGTLVVTSDGQLSYVPGPLGEDAAVYQICDTNNLCANATLIIYQVGD